MITKKMWTAVYLAMSSGFLIQSVDYAYVKIVIPGISANCLYGEQKMAVLQKLRLDEVVLSEEVKHSINPKTRKPLQYLEVRLKH